MRKPILFCVGIVSLVIACGSGGGSSGDESCNKANCKTGSKMYDACSKGSDMLIYKYGGQTCQAGTMDQAGLTACIQKIDAWCAMP